MTHVSKIIAPNLGLHIYYVSSNFQTYIYSAGCKRTVAYIFFEIVPNLYIYSFSFRLKYLWRLLQTYIFM